MEVRGVEPRSAKFFVSNSPSAAADELSAREITAAISHWPIRKGLARQSRKPAGGIPH